MLLFGLLKFLNPTIDGWFTVQIQQSHLPHSAILMGKIAEITTGLLFLLPRFRTWQAKWEDRILLIACSSLFLEMLVAVYVHLQPGVPPEVLPLGIKPPVIPLFVLLLDVMVAIPAWKDSQTDGLRRTSPGIVPGGVERASSRIQRQPTSQLRTGLKS